MRIIKKLGVYSLRGAHPVAKAFMEGLHAIGHDGRHRSHSDYGINDTEAFDAVVVFGLRGQGARILAEYERKRVPVIVVDYGYVRRVNSEADQSTGHWQVSVGGLNKLPPFECPWDRFEALEVPLEPPVERYGPVVLCVQRVGDAAHPFDTETKLRAWIDSVPHDEVRGHPLDGEVENLGSMLDRAKKLVTWNSNIGHDALLAGVPVEALGDAPYKDVTMDGRQAYFARVAYGQWTMEEMRAGLPQRFVMDHVLPGVAPDVPKPVDPAPNLQPAHIRKLTEMPDSAVPGAAAQPSLDLAGTPEVAPAPSEPAPPAAPPPRSGGQRSGRR